MKPFRIVALLLASAALFGCGSDDASSGEPPVDRDWACEVASPDAPDFVERVGCLEDFDWLASAPLDATIPGARSVKVVLDRLDGNALYFQNSVKYPIHYDFASAHLSKPGLVVPLLQEFNRTQYYDSNRRFVLGAVTYYEQPDVWALEIAPYDTADAEMIRALYARVRELTYFGPRLAFVPTSEAVALEAEPLGDDVRITTTDELFAGTEYQPLNLGRTVGRLRFVRAEDLLTEYLDFRDVVVLDAVPNDISVVSGLITEQFQTPLSHVNVLAQNRKTPNMGLRGASTRPELRALEGEWVEFTVGANEWSIRGATQAEADAFWEEFGPEPVELPALDLSVTALTDVQAIVTESDEPLRDSIQRAVLAFGAKASNYSILAKTDDVPVRPGFAIPVYYYVQFMEENGFYEQVDALLADPVFQTDPKERDAKLRELREAMGVAPVNAEFQALLRDKLETDYPGQTMRFRTSTNAEDLDGFPCAGCYESHTGDPADWDGDLLNAIRDTWAGVWFFRTFEERAYHGIDHQSVGMALLVHHNFPAEEANGVALTANPFDPQGLEPGFYVNVQWGGAVEVVHPPPGAKSDEILYFFDSPNQPVTYLSHSNFVPDGETVLSRSQLFELGTALEAIHARFSPAYGPAAGNDAWYAMDVEFKFDDEFSPGMPPTLQVKQARPHPGRGQ